MSYEQVDPQNCPVSVPSGFALPAIAEVLFVAFGTSISSSSERQRRREWRKETLCVAGNVDSQNWKSGLVPAVN